MSRLLVFAAVAALVCFAFWVGGFDFDQRGFAAFMCLISAFAVGILAATYPGNYPWEKFR